MKTYSFKANAVIEADTLYEAKRMIITSLTDPDCDYYSEESVVGYIDLAQLDEGDGDID